MAQLEAERDEADRNSKMLMQKIEDMENQAKLNAHYRDALSYKERLSEMKFEWLDDAYLSNRAGLASSLMDSMSYSLNNN